MVMFKSKSSFSFSLSLLCALAMHTFTLALSLSSAFPHCSVTDSLFHSVYIPNLRRCCFGEAKTFEVLVEAKEGESRAACYRLDSVLVVVV